MRGETRVFQSDNDPDQRGPGIEHPFVKTDHRSSVASDSYAALGDGLKILNR